LGKCHMQVYCYHDCALSEKSLKSIPKKTLWPFFQDLARSDSARRSLSFQAVRAAQTARAAVIVRIRSIVAAARAAAAQNARAAR